MMLRSVRARFSSCFSSFEPAARQQLGPDLGFWHRYSRGRGAAAGAKGDKIEEIPARG
jgi:hypothetical protein